jgi:hypothetical protein
MLREANAVYSNNHMEIKHKVSVRSSDIFNVDAGGIHKCSQHCQLQGQNGQKNTLLAHEMFTQY